MLVREVRPDFLEALVDKLETEINYTWQGFGICDLVLGILSQGSQACLDQLL